VSTPLRVLIVEDSEEDALLLVRELRQGGYEPCFELVETGEAMRAALGRGPWDLILADYLLPRFSAPEALAAARELAPDVPFLVISGRIGEETAVDMMKAGAHDYLMKDNLARFLPAVHRELREAEGRRQRRRAEQEREALRRLHENVLTTIPSALLVLDAELRVVLANRCYLEGQGLDARDVWRKSITDLPPRALLSQPPLVEKIRAVAAAGGAAELLGLRVPSGKRHDDYFNAWVCGIRPMAAEEKGTFTAGTFCFPPPRGAPQAASRESRMSPWGAEGCCAEKENVPFSARVLVVIEDVTRQRVLEAQVHQRARFESLGKLAAGIAHDFNNMLTGIIGFAQLSLAELPANSQVAHYLGQVYQLGQRAAGLTRQIVAFGRQQLLQPSAANLNDVVGASLDLLRQLVGEQISIRFLPAPDLGTVCVDVSQIDQVLTNLVVNARDAMGARGTLTVETANVDLDEAYAEDHVGTGPGRYVRLAVSDTGCGMTQEVVERIFEPFFTTKGPGEGSGLGLSTVYGIVKQHGGNVWVYSEPGRGTTFKIYLPRVEAGAEPVPGERGTFEGDILLSAPKGGAEGRRAEKENVPFPARPAAGRETILVVEDRKAVLDLARLALEKLGYEVLAAATPREAEEAFERRQEDIMLLLADVILSEGTGPELHRRLAEKRPSLKVLYMSGYPSSVVSQQAVLDASSALLVKPFTPSALASKVREVLDAQEGG